MKSLGKIISAAALLMMLASCGFEYHAEDSVDTPFGPVPGWFETNINTCNTCGDNGGTS